MERALIEYAANAVWQLPVLAAGAWLLVWTARPGAAVQHRIWLGVLALALVLPLHGAFSDAGSGAARVEVVPAQNSGVAQRGVAGTQAGSNRATVDSVSRDAAGGTSIDEIGEPGGLVLGTLGREMGGATRGASWAGWGLSALERVHRIRVNATAAEWITGLYLAVMLLGLLRIALAWRTARRLVRDSREMRLTGRERAVVEECARRLGVAVPEIRAVEVRESGAIAGPVVVGAARPVLLWPEGFAGGLCAENRRDEAKAALCHEMAHIRRRDYLANLLCEAAGVPLKWHPVTYGVERRIRSTREMVCDGMAAEAMESQMKYANCLLRLAESMVAGGGMLEQAGAVGLFNGNVLEERVMRLMTTEKAMSVRAKVARGVAGVAAMTAAVALGMVFHVVPAKAQTAAPAETPSSGVAAPRAVVPPAAKPAMPPLTPHSRRTATRVHTQILPPLPPVPGEPVSQAKLAPLAALPPLPPLAPHSGRTISTIHTQVALPSVLPVPAPQATPAPEPQTLPAPAVKPTPAPKPDAAPYHHEAIVSEDGRAYVCVNGQKRELTPAERAKLEKQLEDAQKKIAAETARINSPEFREQIENAEREAIDAQRKLNSGEMQEQLAEAQRKLSSPEFKKQMEEAQRKAMVEVQQELSSAEFQSKMDEAQKQVADAMAKLNSPEFRNQMQEAEQKAMDAQRKLNSGEIQKQMADAQKQLQQEIEKLKTEDKSPQQ